MKSENFEFIRTKWPELASLGGFAEAYTHTDPASALVKLRLFAENMTKDIYRDLALPKPDQPTFVELLTNHSFKAITPKVVLDKLHALRIHGNKAAHGEPATSKSALWLLQEAYDLARWSFIQYAKGDLKSIPAYSAPTGQDDSKGQLKREKKAILEKLAAQEAQMSELLKELDQVRTAAATVEKQKEEIKALANSAQESANLLEFDETTTRARIIDSLLADAGWHVAAGEESTDEVGKEVQLEDQPTPSGTGYADYVLWNDDEKPLAVIEAKRTSVNPEKGRKQAELYADALEKQYGQRPVIFYTNGYDIWLWDDAQGYPPRKVYGYYSKDSLQYLVTFQRQSKKPLDSLEPDENIINRLYQIEAVKRVTERFTQKHRKSLVVQATGTGKTRVAIALAELLIRAGWVKRVLFLCDRRELRKQAKNAFNNFTPSEPIRIVTSRANRSASERIFIATYPAMQKVYRSFDTGYFDLIIADESHRSIYNVYGDLFHYFDCLQVGLTATPIDFVTRSTFDLFNCEGQLPTANYDLEQAIDEGYLTPFEVFEHTTQFLREGIRLEVLTKDQIQQLEDQGEDPAQYDFSAEQIDKAIFNKATNREIIRNLMENGLRDASGQVPGKSIIFARNHDHADLLFKLFNEMYPQYGGKFCQIIDTYNPRAEDLIDDFKGEGSNSELTIAISVDMLDTGIDVPEITNLVFAKPVKSPVKFWQMIGRGTRLCENLYGPGQDKTIFRTFDHWGNFERFETGYRPAEPKQNKSLMQLLFEERINLAETALRASEIDAFNTVIDLLAKDLEDLPEKSVSVHEKWREKRAVSAPETLKAFAPNTVAMMRQEIAPLMQWMNIRGFTEARSLDLLFARMEIALMRKSGSLLDLKIDLMDRLAKLSMNQNQVKDRAEIIKRVKSDEFWNNPSFPSFEDARRQLREIMHLQEKGSITPLPTKVIDVDEDEAGFEIKRRSTNLRSVDMKAYKQVVEAELKKHFETDTTLRKIRTGESVTETDIRSLISLVVAQNPNIAEQDLEEFFSDTAKPVEFLIREMVGMDADAVAQHFSNFALRHPKLTAKQLRFIGLLQNHITKFGTITIDRLYDQPFTVIDADGLDGVFEDNAEVEDLIHVINFFAPPDETTERNQEPERKE